VQFVTIGGRRARLQSRSWGRCLRHSGRAGNARLFRNRSAAWVDSFDSGLGFIQGCGEMLASAPCLRAGRPAKADRNDKPNPVGDAVPATLVQFRAIFQQQVSRLGRGQFSPACRVHPWRQEQNFVAAPAQIAGIEVRRHWCHKITKCLIPVDIRMAEVIRLARPMTWTPQTAFARLGRSGGQGLGGVRAFSDCAHQAANGKDVRGA